MNDPVAHIENCRFIGSNSEKDGKYYAFADDGGFQSIKLIGWTCIGPLVTAPGWRMRLALWLLGHEYKIEKAATPSNQRSE